MESLAFAGRLSVYNRILSAPLDGSWGYPFSYPFAV